jgi:hypothetical protein
MAHLERIDRMPELKGSERFSVQSCTHYPNGYTRDGGVRGFRVVAYPAHFTCESATVATEEEAKAWAERLNRGEKVPEANLASYADRD